MTLADRLSEQAVPASLDGLLGLCAPSMAQVNEVILSRMASDVPLIPELAGHLIAAGGKRMRPMLCVAGAIAASGQTDVPEDALKLSLIHI